VDRGSGELREDGAGEAGVGVPRSRDALSRATAVAGRAFARIWDVGFFIFPRGCGTRFRADLGCWILYFPPRLRDALTRATAVAGRAYARILNF